jgi:tRNA1Val (adenine37-N6)-methyltransferase
VKTPGETIDGLFRNKIRVIQARKGYRVSEDAIILTWFTNAKPFETMLDAGTGSGAIAFGLAILQPTIFVIGLEIQSALANRAHRGLMLNDLGGRVSIIKGDLREADIFLRHGKFDAVVSNPPYYEPGRGRINLEEEKALSRHQMMMPIEDLFRVASHILKIDGRISIIYPAAGFAKIESAMIRAGFEASRVLWIHSQEGVEPGLVCVEAKRNSSELLQSRLYLYQSPGRRTALAEAILSGEVFDRDFDISWKYLNKVSHQ